MARTIPFLLKYENPWPLWQPGSGHYSTGPANYGLSAELTELLQHRYALWGDHFSDKTRMGLNRRRRAMDGGEPSPWRHARKVADFAEVFNELDS